MDWNNVDINSNYERDQNILDPYSFSDLILEMNCNANVYNVNTLETQFNESLENLIASAREVFEANKENILAYLLSQKD